MSEETIVNMDASNLQIVLILTAGFTLAAILGYLVQCVRFSPLLGYLLAGYLIGPFFPGFTADLIIAEQLAEIGVILMLFGVGLHFKWQDLLAVRNIAVFGAVGQTAIATIASTFLVHMIGWSWESGLIIGLAIGVASTVVMVRVLSDRELLDTPEGHIAVGWLIAEDILTVIALVLLPTLVYILQGGNVSLFEIAEATSFVLLKFVLLIGFMFTGGQKIVSFVLHAAKKTDSAELFTLAILALTFLIATGSALLFGTSIALGAFIAGMVIGQTNERHRAAIHASPIKDAFLVMFFLSVGMLFNPVAIAENFPLFLSVLFVILVVKPLSAFLIVRLFRYPVHTAFILAVSLAQIGEFSFILASAAIKYKILPDEGYDIIVACALVSITINPFLFGFKQTPNRPKTENVPIEIS